jgi:hypothetical protein
MVEFFLNTDALADTDKPRVVETSHLVCSKGPKRKGTRTHMYHWRIFAGLVHSSTLKTKFVEIDMSPVTEDGGTMLDVASKLYTNSDKVIASIAIASTGGPATISRILEVLVANKREKYTFDDTTGSGCRWWCEVVVGDLENANLVPAGSRKTLKEFMDETAKIDPIGMPTPSPRGIFHP